MEELLQIVQLGELAVFGAITALAARLWLRRRGAPTFWSMATFGVIFGVLAFSLPVPPESRSLVADLSRRAAYLLFFAIPWSFNRFAGSLARVSPRVARVCALLTVAAITPAFLQRMPRPDEPRPAWVPPVVLALGVGWTLLSADAVRGLWREARRLGSLAGRRLRVIARGAVVLNLALIVTLMLPPDAPPVLRLVSQILGLSSAVLFFVGITPTRGLRTRWRQAEVRDFRVAARELVSTASEDAIRDAVLPYAARLVGGSAAWLVAPNGEVVATWEIDAEEAARRTPPLPAVQPGISVERDGILAVPVHLKWLVVDMSLQAPAFSRDDLVLLQELSDLAGLAMDRARLFDRERRARLALEEREQQLAEAQELAEFGSYSWDIDTHEAVWSAQMFRIYGLPAGQHPDIPTFLQLIHPDDRAHVAEVTQRALETGETVDVEYRIVRPDGEVRWLRGKGQAVPTADGRRRMVGIIHDTTERKRSEARLAYQALHDALTGLPNRYLVVDRLDHALGRARRDGRWPAVLFLDLDRFKVVNDGLGHRVGDELLRLVGARLRETVRPSDTVARLGGDEFVVLVEGGDSEGEVRALATRVCAAIAQPFEIDGREIRITASVGVAVAGEEETDAEGMLRDSDAAMYKAKDAGRARVEVFTASLRAEAVARLELEADLRAAIEGGELSLAFQPAISVADGSIVGVECLVRWESPARGRTSVQDLVRVAEECDLIVPLGRWVVRSAMAQARRWRDAGYPITCWMNISAHQFRRDDVVALVSEAADEAGVPLTQIGIELTESTLIGSSASVGTAITELKARGVRLAIDDFGTGFSSLSYLRRFPVDVVKIDKSFVQGLGTDPEDEAIVGACVALGQTLGLVTVAEGVERWKQLDALRAMGCVQAQGYLFSAPVSADDVIALIERRSLSTSARTQRPRILVCDDDPAVRVLYRLAFEAEGVDVVEVTSAEECVVSAAASSPDLVLLDLVLPGHDGLWALRRLRSTLDEEIPIIVVTATDAGEIRRKAESDGADACYDKAGFVEMIPKVVQTLIAA